MKTVGDPACPMPTGPRYRVQQFNLELSIEPGLPCRIDAATPATTDSPLALDAVATTRSRAESSIERPTCVVPSMHRVSGGTEAAMRPTRRRRRVPQPPWQRARDATRDAKLEALGWKVIRVDAERLRERPWTILTEIERAQSAGGEGPVGNPAGPVGNPAGHSRQPGRAQSAVRTGLAAEPAGLRGPGRTRGPSHRRHR